ncbi:MAG TPA: hypothetical protein VFG42_05510 [Baekduia sp.]|uniref:hypothetical protein n=1 Tax=Baekduia sp. TaxID=2600305 RepID=UPI002D79B9B2|nr:hypothetical protein [Baekduia sp.]HET6506224.1 hypothetical protein [Baekduia sp.]
MRVKRYALVSAAVLAAGAGGGAAIAASNNDDRQKTEQSILDDAAQRLNVSPEALKSALGEAEDAQLDAEVKAGRLTQEQADAIKKARARSGTVLGGPGVGGPGVNGRAAGAGHPAFGGPPQGGPGLRFGLDIRGGAIDAAAGALGLSRDDLVSKLKAGRSIADVAKARGTSLDDVETAITGAVTKELDQRVTDGKLTAEQRDKLLARLAAHLDELVSLTPPQARSGTMPAHPFFRHP